MTNTEKVTVGCLSAMIPLIENLAGEVEIFVKSVPGALTICISERKLRKRSPCYLRRLLKRKQLALERNALNENLASVETKDSSEAFLEEIKVVPRDVCRVKQHLEYDICLVRQACCIPLPAPDHKENVHFGLVPLTSHPAFIPCTKLTNPPGVETFSYTPISPEATQVSYLKSFHSLRDHLNDYLFHRLDSEIVKHPLVVKYHWEDPDHHRPFNWH